MMKVRGSFVGHFLWTSYMGDLKDNNDTNKTHVWNQNGSNIPKILNSNKTNSNLIILPLTQMLRTTPLIWHLHFQSQQWKRQSNVWDVQS